MAEYKLPYKGSQVEVLLRKIDGADTDGMARSLDALWKLNNGISYQYETDDTTAYQKTVPSGAKLCSLSKIGGRTLVWNQLCNPSNFENTVTRNGITYTNNVDGSISVSGTAEANSVFSFGYFDNVIGHKVLVIGCPEGGSENTFSINRGNGNIADVGNGRILTLEDYDTYFKIAVIQGATVDNLVFKPQIFDLTKMFGAGNEPSTVEEFEAMFPNDYYPYNSGELMSFPMNKMVEQGRNLFDINNVNLYQGYLSSADNRITSQASKNYERSVIVECEPNTTYTIKIDTSVSKMLRVGAFETYPETHMFSSLVVNHSGNTVTITTRSTDHYLFIFCWNNKDTTDAQVLECIGGMQIELGETATAYSPYHQNLIPTPQAILDLDGFGESAGNVYNYVNKENKLYHKRIGAVDLGQLNYGVLSSNRFYSNKLIGIVNNVASDNTVGNILCAKYQPSKWNGILDKQIAITSSGNIGIRDSDYTDAESFKAAMAGVILLYELAEEEVIDISDLLTDDEPFEVEAGGSLTFQNSNGDGYRVPIPTEEKYIVSLAEVTV